MAVPLWKSRIHKVLTMTRQQCVNADSGQPERHNKGAGKSNIVATRFRAAGAAKPAEKNRHTGCGLIAGADEFDPDNLSTWSAAAELTFKGH